MSAGPTLTVKVRAERAAQQERLAKALRDNLRRRKEQSREREAARDAGVGGLSATPLSSKSKRRGGNTVD